MKTIIISTRAGSAWDQLPCTMRAQSARGRRDHKDALVLG